MAAVDYQCDPRYVMKPTLLLLLCGYVFPAPTFGLSFAVSTSTSHFILFHLDFHTHALDLTL